MVAIVKIKITYFRKSASAEDGSIIWIYKTKDESLHNGSGISESALDRSGYKLMKYNSNLEQYAIDLSFNGKKDIIYSSIESEIRPLLRDKLLTELLEY